MDGLASGDRGYLLDHLACRPVLIVYDVNDTKLEILMHNILKWSEINA